MTMKTKVYCNKQDCTLRKTFIGDTGEYSRNLCCNTDCDLAKEYSPQSEATISGWVARDRNGSLALYQSIPERLENLGYWRDGLGGEFDLSETDFPSLTWDDEPIEVEITIKPKKQ